jgi:hypothetical protein
MSDDKKAVPDPELDDLSGGRAVEGRGPIGHEPDVMGRSKTPEFIERGGMENDLRR